MKILIDNGRIRSIATGLGQVSAQFASALMRISPPDMQFQFLTHPKFNEFADLAARIGATHVKGRFSPLNKIRRVFDKRFFAYVYNGQQHSLRHALHRQHMTIPASDKSPFIFTVHDMHLLSGSPRSRKRNLRAMRETVARSDFVAFISQYSKNIASEHIDFANKETQIIYNGVDKPPEDNAKRPSWFQDSMRPFLFSIAQITEHKNYHILPPVMSRLPGYSLILAGKHKADGAPLLQESIARERLTDKVIVPGAIAENEKAFLLRECSGFVFPSLKEGFGMPVIEAFHYGKPVFCFANTALPEVGGDFAFYWQNQEPQEMADLIRENIFETPNAEDVQARQQWAQSFSWERNAEAYLNIYRKLTAK